MDRTNTTRRSRRDAFTRIGAVVAGAPAGRADATEQAAVEIRNRASGSQAPSSTLVPHDELVNVLEFEVEAARALSAGTPAGRAADLARGDRAITDRITLRPRMCVPTSDMDLGVTLFGERHFTPIIAGPVAAHTRYHPEGETASVIGANAANAALVLTNRSGVPIDQLPASTAPRWFQVFAGDARAVADVEQATSHGCSVVCVTVGVVPAGPTAASAAPASRPAAPDWNAVRAVKRSTTHPVIVKGITSTADARIALDAGADGIVVSNYAGAAGAKQSSLLLELAPIADFAAGRVPVLVDGGFTRGSDIIKALAFGAAAVLVARPVMWGLAAYGREGIQAVLEMLQTELARFMAMSGHVTVSTLDRALVRVHS